MTFRTSAPIGADVEHNTSHSHFPMCECFVSGELSCDPCERVAKVVRCICHLGAFALDTSHLSISLSFRDGPLDEPQSLSTVMMPYIGVKSQRCTKRLPTFSVRCSGFASGPNCSTAPAFCPSLIHGGCWHKKVVVPDLGWVVVRGAANDSKSRFVFPLQF